MEVSRNPSLLVLLCGAMHLALVVIVLSAVVLAVVVLLQQPLCWI